MIFCITTHVYSPEEVMFQKGYLVLLIVGLTVCLVLVWLTVDFILYYKRKNAVRAAKMYMFYTKVPMERLALPFTVQIENDKDTNDSTKKRNKRQSSFKRFMNFIKKKVTSDSDENEILDNDVMSYESEMSDKVSSISSEKGEKESSDPKSEEELPQKEQVDKKPSIEAMFNINPVEDQTIESEKEDTFTPPSPVKSSKSVKHRSSSTSLWSTTSSEFNPRAVPLRGKRKNSVGPITIENKVKKTALPPLELTVLKNDSGVSSENEVKQKEESMNMDIYKLSNTVLPPLELPGLRKGTGTKLNEEELRELEQSLVQAQGDTDVLEESN